MSQPIYESIADALREHVATLDPGQRLPSEAVLCGQYGVARNTLRQALGLLESEGLIIGKQGRGWTVREFDRLRWNIDRPENNTDDTVSPSDAWAKDVRDQGRVPAESLEVATLVAGARIGGLLRIDRQSLVVARRRQRFVDGLLYMLDVSYYSRELVRGTAIEEPHDILPGVWQVMESLDRGWVDPPLDEIYARPATSAEADLFGVLPGSPILERFRVRRTATGEPVAVTHTIGPGERLIVVTGDEVEK